MVVNLTWHSSMEQVWGIRLRCLTNCTCCETSELELFHIQFESHADLCEHQKRLYINTIPCTYRQLGSTMTSISYTGEKRITHRQQFCTTASSFNTCCHYSEDTCCCWRPLLAETFTVSFQGSLTIEGKLPMDAEQQFVMMWNVFSSLQRKKR